MYRIGDCVYVKATMNRHKNWNTKEVSWERKPTSKVIKGWIVGACRKFSGKQIPSIRHTDFEGNDDYDSGYLQITDSHYFYLVRLGMLNKPIRVKEDDLVFVQPDKHYKIPKLYIKHDKYIYSTAYRNEMREIMKDYPRDSRGRWLKGV